MKNRLRIVMIASECVPFAKTGGLADIVGALPQALTRLGHDVMVVIPKYGQIDWVAQDIQPFLIPMGVWMGNVEEWCAVHRTTMGEHVAVFLIESDKYFGRDGLYHDADFHDYPDNARRFAFFTRAALQLCRDLPFRADIVHVHDWQTALAPAYLKVWHWDDAVLGGAASVLTIHNLGYQGKFPAAEYDYIGLGWGNFTPDKLEDYGGVNFLKGGIQYADLVTTVSPTYARETCTPEGGWGLTPYLRDKGDDYVGILNGVDYVEWNPATDPLIAANYTRANMAGKVVCKRALQRRFMLEQDPAVALIGVISRLAQQKGLHLLADVIEDLVRDMAVQFALLGSGEKGLEAYFGDLPARYPGRIGCYIGYNNELAHWIEAGCDFLAMPSLYEPCGLNQIYSLRYGTLPIVRAVGGLDDTVEQYDERTGAGTGFKFRDPTSAALYDTIGWAVSTTYDRPEHLAAMIQRAMSRRFTVDSMAQEYVRAYERAVAVKRSL